MPAITADYIRTVLHYDPETGEFRRIRRGRGPLPRAGVRYRTITVDGRGYRAHVLAWLYVHGRWPSGVVDHVNCDPTDNRIVNLRDIPSAGNVQNQRRAHRNNRLGCLGVEQLSSGRFRARLNTGGRLAQVGIYETVEEASAAYWAAKQAAHPYAVVPS